MTMSIGERAEAIRRAKHALALLGAHRTTSKERLGAAREHLNARHRLAESPRVWKAVRGVEADAAEGREWDELGSEWLPQNLTPPSGGLETPPSSPDAI